VLRPAGSRGGGADCCSSSTTRREFFLDGTMNSINR
jgi:hypothetical protein